MFREKRLVDRIRAGDRRGFDELIEVYGARIRDIAARYTRCPADADDAVQEIFVELFRSVPAFRGEASLSTFVYRIAVNACLRRKRGTTIETVALEESSAGPDMRAIVNPGRVAERAELNDHLGAALAELSEVQREVVVLHELHGLTYGECAAVLGVPIGTIKSRLSNAFGHLRTSLGDYLTETGTALNSSRTEAAS